jgi:hypothetical protein
VNVNSQNPTVVFLTFGQIPAGYVPAESLWCGALVPATPPALGQQCRPDTIYGSLPARYNQSQSSGSGGLTDIMAIPPSVARRAYQAAQEGGSAGFFYVRRFVSTAGQPDQFVVVTCRMSGGGARVPFALTNVEIKTPSKEPILFVKAGEKFPEIYADIWYNGTGRLKGRWEIVQPGEEPPAERDLLTESTLPIEQRGTQKRYRQIARFNYFLPPARRFKLPLEQIDKVPTLAAGQYTLLLRIEATDDKESDSNLAAIGAGAGVVHSGAVSAFPLPTLKFFVIGNDERTDWQADARVTRSAAADINQPVKTFLPVVFSWKPFPTAALHRLEIFDENEKMVLSALLLSPISSYRAPSWFLVQYDTKNLTWRVVALDETGTVIRETRKQFF